MRSTTRIALFACLGVIACARSAPDLPPDYASVNSRETLSLHDFDQDDVDATCGEIAAEKVQIRSDYATLERQITSTRTKEQSGGYIAAVLFAPLALALDQKLEAKKRLDEMQARLDKLIALSLLKRCAKGASPSSE